ncbi:geranyl-CoA carboxylase subunit apha [Marinobacter nanhaiticus D15-8W]|uniref:Biotin carboxylase n=1 Tax=Marinobacter nanhaiticus D15-8W TaxID=626887 RepID=N6VT06_9GAMM|nr:acetyl/propionyl/methylcrotonyl-CoA carboxylase subunit alpha [Marinobacter nanhaiticus]ENO13270.1 acetyl/propionyl/methylcrotonyl-CoA carboxylase subunit alpha [Marinobacter nanhaiticus D15-8W]BES70634.1 geranyl-CoA carboxylase subunit apha [Marinobacter nanhaiticus D15-8W]
MLNKILIANRGEIAVRIMRTAHALGYRTVAVYSDADKDALHVHTAEEAVCIGPATVNASYLNIEAILEAAKRTGADAIHPGYGFLSENAAFASTCVDAGLVFIGPPAEAIELMGSKRRSKIAMQEAGVPVVPGFEQANASDEALQDAAEKMGFPAMIKASAGGGGRGMRLVREAAQLPDQIQRARSEAKNAFGDDELILEKAVIEPRHIEVQVFADRHGNVIHLGERDCSIQRRHQKVVEEAPSPFMTPALREAMGDAAVKAAKACDYVGAGTVEFLVDKDRNFYFLEMNTRLQVEHPVTELVTGQDLVQWQIRVAEGETLPLTQDDIRLTGHAVEVRLYAEDPATDFMPQTGTLFDYSPAELPGLRYDSGVRTGDAISPFYDPMLAKVIAYGETRTEAIRRLKRALEDTRVFGVTTNRGFLSRIMAHPCFIAGEATTAFLDNDFADDPSMQTGRASLKELGLAALLLSYDDVSTSRWSNSLPTPLPLRLAVDDQYHDVRLLWDRQRLTIADGDSSATLEVTSLGEHELDYIDNGVRQRCQYQRCGDRLYLQQLSRAFCVRDVTHAPVSMLDGGASDRVLASMDGAIIDVRAEPGQNVQRGDTLVVLEAMKMEHPLVAERDGIVETVHVTTGTQVKRRQLLVALSGEETPSNEGASA